LPFLQIIDKLNKFIFLSGVTFGPFLFVDDFISYEYKTILNIEFLHFPNVNFCNDTVQVLETLDLEDERFGVEDHHLLFREELQEQHEGLVLIALGHPTVQTALLIL